MQRDDPYHYLLAIIESVDIGETHRFHLVLSLFTSLYSIILFSSRICTVKREHFQLMNPHSHAIFALLCLIYVLSISSVIVHIIT